MGEVPCGPYLVDRVGVDRAFNRQHAGRPSAAGEEVRAVPLHYAGKLDRRARERRRATVEKFPDMNHVGRIEGTRANRVGRLAGVLGEGDVYDARPVVDDLDDAAVDPVYPGEPAAVIREGVSHELAQSLEGGSPRVDGRKLGLRR